MYYLETLPPEGPRYMPFRLTPNATITIWDRPPDNFAAEVVAYNVPIRQLKPWGPLDIDQMATSALGFLFRWAIFFGGFIPIQKTDRMDPDIFYATLDGIPTDVYYQGAWSQTVMNGDTIDYVYMVLRAVYFVPIGPSLVGGHRGDRTFR